MARKALDEMHSKGLIKQVIKHHSQIIYTRTTKGDDGPDDFNDGQGEEEKGKKGKKGKN